MKEDFINSNIIQPVFLGFGIVTFILLYFDVVLKINTRKLINSSLYIIKCSGIIYIMLWCTCLFLDKSLINRFSGKYWFNGWFLMFTYPILSQLFWIKKVRKSNLLIYIISILFIISNFIFSGKIICFDGDCDMAIFILEILKQIGIYLIMLLLVTYLLKINSTPTNKT